MKKLLFFTLLLFMVFGLADISAAKKAKQPVVDKDEIKRLSERDFDSIINLWRDEKYEELYEYGTLSSHVRISKEGFIRGMRHKKFKLMCCGDAAREIDVIYKSPTVVYVKAKMGYKNHLNKEAFRHETFRLVFEGGKWKTDIARILKLPKVRE